MYLMVSLALFLLFTANVLKGSMTGAPFLGDVSEMLLLLAVSVSFVAAIIKAQQDENKSESDH